MFTKVKSFFTFTLITVLLSITSITNAGDFAIKEVKVKSSKVLEVSFTNDLAENSEQLSEFMITENSDNASDLEIKSLELVSTNTLKINLGWELKSNTKYNLTAIFVADSGGAVIESWASWMATFETPDFSLQSTWDSTVEESNQEVTTEELNWDSLEISTQENITESENWIQESTTNSSEDVVNEENMTEVKTWTQEVLIVFLALLLAFLFLSVRRKA